MTFKLRCVPRFINNKYFKYVFFMHVYLFNKYYVQWVNVIYNLNKLLYISDSSAYILIAYCITYTQNIFINIICQLLKFPR